MIKEKIEENKYMDWYAIWLGQSKKFFESAHKNLHAIFEKQNRQYSEENLKKIETWLTSLKEQWAKMDLSAQPKNYFNYWEIMMAMANKASDRLLEEWMQRSHSSNPIKSIQELYEVWLACSQAVYRETLQTQMYQEAQVSFMQAALKYWESFIPNK